MDVLPLGLDDGDESTQRGTLLYQLTPINIPIGWMDEG